MKKIAYALVFALSIGPASIATADNPASLSQPVPTDEKITTESGLQYQILERKNKKGKQAVAGATVKVHYIGTLPDGTEFDQSYKRGKPFEFELGKGKVIKGWDEGIAYLREGDKARLWIPANLGYGSRSTGKIPANSDLIFDVELIEVILPPEQWDVSKVKPETTASGLQVYRLTATKGEMPGVGDNVKVHYSGYLRSNGNMFDSSVQRGQPFSFPLGKGRVIKGWDEGIAMLRVGEKAQLVIPANLAYGDKARSGIPANSDLVFDVELIEVTPAPKPWDTSKIDAEVQPSGLKVYKTHKTPGQQAKIGKTVRVHYSGYLEDGTMFDSSHSRGQPLEFPLGRGKVIKGWDAGIALMRVGEKAQLVIPPELGYGERGAGGAIPPNATLIFDVELVGIK